MCDSLFFSWKHFVGCYRNAFFVTMTTSSSDKREIQRARDGELEHDKEKDRDEGEMDKLV